jgi:cobalt-zinc-cadmium efflux system protein
MGREHAHHRHDHRPSGSPARPLGIALALTGSFLVIEAIAGWWTGSLALVSDAGHMATDAGALVLALVAQAIAGRARSGEKTFGYRRAEILAALANGVVLGATSIWIVVEASSRLLTPTAIRGLPMLVVAVAGLAINLIAAAVLRRDRSNPNVRAAAAHVVSDAMGSIAAILAGLAIWSRGWLWVDPLVSIAIAALILRSSWHVIRDAVDVLMEGAPRELDYRAIERTIAATAGVAALHDLHVWSISEGFPAVSVHVVLDGVHHGTEVARAVGARIREAHGVEHVTVQPEAPVPSVVPVGSLKKKRRRHVT